MVITQEGGDVMTFQLGSPLLDACVLAILVKEDAYGYTLTQKVKEVIDISESTLYPILRRLQKENCLTTYDQPYQGRNRRYYRITKEGDKRYHFYQKEWEQYKTQIDQLLGGKPNFAFEIHEKKIITEKSQKMITGEEKLDGFSRLELEADYANISIVEGDEYKVSYALNKEPVITQNGNCLSIKDSAKGFSINFGFTTNEDKTITITIPKEQKDLDIKAVVEAGDVTVKGVSINNGSYDLEYGQFDMKDCEANIIALQLESGSCSITDSTLDGFQGELEYGDTYIQNCTMNKIDVDSESGDANVDISGNLPDYSIQLDVEVGEVTVNGKKEAHSIRTSGDDSSKAIHVESEYGEVDITVEP